MKKGIVFMNEQHTLMAQQKEVLNAEFGEDGWEVRLIPARGWTADDMNVVYDDTLVKAYELTRNQYEEAVIVFVSPVPLLIKKFSQFALGTGWLNVKIFHNDRREKKELPSGQVIMTVAKEGWQLL